MANRTFCEIPTVRRGNGRRPPGAKQATGSFPAGEQLSEDPLRNVRLLLVSGEAMALQGEGEEGIKTLEKALTLAERFGGPAAKVRLILGEALLWLSTPLGPHLDYPLREKGLRHLEQALEYYRANGPLVELARALQLAARGSWMLGRNRRAVALAAEGLELIAAAGDREAESRLALMLGLALRESYQLAEAKAAFERTIECLPYLTSNWEIMWILLERGILAGIIGDLAEAERFFREGLALCRLTPPFFTGEKTCRLHDPLCAHRYAPLPGKNPGNGRTPARSGNREI